MILEKNWKHVRVPAWYVSVCCPVAWPSDSRDRNPSLQQEQGKFSEFTGQQRVPWDSETQVHKHTGSRRH